MLTSSSAGTRPLSLRVLDLQDLLHRLFLAKHIWWCDPDIIASDPEALCERCIVDDRPPLEVGIPEIRQAKSEASCRLRLETPLPLRAPRCRRQACMCRCRHSPPNGPASSMAPCTRGKKAHGESCRLPQCPRAHRARRERQPATPEIRSRPIARPANKACRQAIGSAPSSRREFWVAIR